MVRGIRVSLRETNQSFSASRRIMGSVSVNSTPCSNVSSMDIDSVGRMARQLTVQPHFLHFTTQAVGSASPLVTPTIIGEYMAKVIFSQRSNHARSICPSILLE